VNSSYVLDVPYSLFIGTDGYLLHILRGIERERVLYSSTSSHVYQHLDSHCCWGGGMEGSWIRDQEKIIHTLLVRW
jgi:hypothetical protein